MEPYFSKWYREGLPHFENFTRSVCLGILLLYFEEEQRKCKCGSPYRRGPKKRGIKATLRSVDLLGISLCYLNTKANLYSLCSMLGLVQSSLSVWLDYSLEVMVSVVRRK